MERGDIYLVSLEPVSDHEQQGLMDTILDEVLAKLVAILE